MEKLNSYYGIGINDYLYAKLLMSAGDEIGNYNGIAYMAAQSAEKLLKSIIEQNTYDDEKAFLLDSHNLKLLVNKIKEKYPTIQLDPNDCKWLGDFYYDANYPGDNFVTVNKDDAIECIKINEHIKIVVDGIRKNEKILK